MELRTLAASHNHTADPIFDDVQTVLLSALCLYAFCALNSFMLFMICLLYALLRHNQLICLYSNLIGDFSTLAADIVQAFAKMIFIYVD